MQDNEGNLIIFNGEIYNYQELIKKHNLKKLKTSLILRFCSLFK